MLDYLVITTLVAKTITTDTDKVNEILKYVSKMTSKTPDTYFWIAEYILCKETN